MLEIPSSQLELWLTQYLWPFVRIGAALMTLPVFSGHYVPPRSRLVLAGALTVLIAPLLPLPSAAQIFSATGLVITVQQVVIGVAIGFALQIVFDSLAMGGQLLANSMGLSFAFNIDPLRGTGTPVLGQLYAIVVTLTFLALNGHLAVLEMLVDGFRTLPVGTTGLSSAGLWQIGVWGAQIFAGALSVALPGMTALLIVNVAFGVVSRAAPQLNLFAVGFPITLICGLLIVLVGLPSVQANFTELLQRGFVLIQTLLAPEH